MRLLLFVDTQRRVLVGGLNDPSLATLPPLMQGDTVDVVLQGVEKLADTSTQYYRAIPIPFSAIKCGISRGPDIPPTDGTICMMLGGGSGADVTTPFAPDIDKPDLQTLLNALPGVIAKGGLKVLTKNAATNIFQIAWNQKAETAVIDFKPDTNLLDPPSDTRRTVATLAGGLLQVLKCRQLPLAFTDQFALPAELDVSTAVVRTGTGTRNAIQSITIPRGAAGTVSFTFSTLSTRILSASNGLTATAVAAALNDLYADNQTRFVVTMPSSGVLYVEFVGPFAKADKPLITAEMHDQVPIEQPTAELPLNGPSLELAFDGGEKLGLTFELEITDADGEVGTPIRMPVTVINDVIDGGMSLQHDPPWLDPGSPVYVPPGGGVPSISVPGAYIIPVGTGTTSGTSGRDFVIQHNLGTSRVLVEVRETGGQHLRIPDDQYTCVIPNDNQVEIVFAVAPTLNQYEVIIAGVTPQEMALPHHTHPIGDVVGLRDELTHLQAEIDDITGEDGSGGDLPPIPENRLPVHIPWDNKATDGSFKSWRFDAVPDALIPAGILRSPLKDSDLPPGIPYVDGGGNLVVVFPGTPETTITLIKAPNYTINPTVLPDPSDWPGLYAAIIKALQGGAALPRGFVPMVVPDYVESFPAKVIVQEGTAATAATLPKALPAYQYASTVNGAFPEPGPLLKGKVWKVSGNASAAAVQFRAPQFFNDGQLVGCDGLQFFPVVLDNGGNAWPAEMERELFTLNVTRKMLDRNCRFAVSGQLELSLVGEVAASRRARYVLRVQFGRTDGPALSSIVYDGSVLSEVIVLTGASVIHGFEVAVTRAALTGPDGLTATAALYGRSRDVDPPSSPNFVVRASLVDFDLEDSNDIAVGQVAVSLKNVTASVSDLSQTTQS